MDTIITITEKDAILVTDIQCDFCPEGTLGVSKGNEIIPIINRILPVFKHRIYSMDWHPANHISFSNKPEFKDKSWPVHCVGGTSGAEFHPDLTVTEDAIIIKKGTDLNREAYSAFQDTGLTQTLTDLDVERLFVVGLATDYCVKHTALDAKNNGFDVIIIEDCVRGVDVPSGSVDDAISEMKAIGIVFILSKTILTEESL